MHREAGPRAGLHVLVVQIVDVFIQRLPMNGAVDPVEMEFPPDRNQAAARTVQ